MTAGQGTQTKSIIGGEVSYSPPHTPPIRIENSAAATLFEVREDVINRGDAHGIDLPWQDTVLTAAQVNALAAANITVVSAAPLQTKANVARIPVAVFIFLDHGGTDFVQVNGTDHLALKYSGGIEISEIGTEAQCTALLEAAADAQLYVPLAGGFIPAANTAIALDNNGAAEYTTGNGTMYVRVFYREVTIAAF